MSPADNQKMHRERARIQWRVFVLSQPGGVEWLRQFARSKEQDVGPHKLTFDRQPT